MAFSEVISFMIGQCGIQTGNSCWNLYGVEHEITSEGIFTGIPDKHDTSVNSFYNESYKQHYVPRTLFIDLEPTVMDELRKGANKNLFHSDTLINTYEDSANNFARGLYTCGRLLINQVAFATRKQMEACNSLRCFVVHHSYGGGTGSGLMSLLLEHLMSDYPKTTKIVLGLIPNETLSSSTVEPYNAILGMHHPMESTDLAILYENEPLYQICKRKLNQPSPTFPHLNELVSQIMSGITASTRFESPLGCNLVDIQTNIVPYPRIHFPLVSFAPIGSSAKNMRYSFSTSEITKASFDRSNQMVSVEANEGRAMACTLLYRGSISSRETFNAVSQIKNCKTMEWVDWCPTGFKVGITCQPSSTTPLTLLGSSLRTVTLLKNSTVVRTVFNRLGQKFWHLFSRKAFLHWFIAEGMEEDEFQGAFDDLMILSADMNLLEKVMEELEEGDLTTVYDKSKAPAPETNDNKYSPKEDSKAKAENSLIEEDQLSTLDIVSENNIPKPKQREETQNQN